jgi:hypothetical protein
MYTYYREPVVCNDNEHVTPGVKEDKEPLKQCVTDKKDTTHHSRYQIEFFPGSIHMEEVRDFWRIKLKASEWVMEVLKEGYVITFIKHPPVYEEVINASAIQELIFV